MPDTTPLPLPRCPREDCRTTIDHFHGLNTGDTYACERLHGARCGRHEEGNSLISRCYAPRTATPAPQPIDPADVRVGDRVRIVTTWEVSITEVHDIALGGKMDDDESVWIDTRDEDAAFYLVGRPDPDARIVEAIARAIAAGAGARAVLDALRAEYAIEPKAVQS